MASGLVEDLTVRRGQVAHMLGISELTFNKRRTALEAAGFPRKLPGMSSWSRAAVAHWINSGGLTYAPLAAEPAGALEEVRTALEQQYAA